MKITDAAVHSALNQWYKSFDADEDDVIDMRKAITAALPHLPLGFEVKKLEWVKQDEKLAWDSVDYRIYVLIGSKPAVYRLLKSSFGTQYVGDFVGANALEQAKAAAQEDFERRVRECIVTKPVDVAAVRELRKIWYIRDLTTDDFDKAEAMLSALSAEPAPGEQWQPTHRHVKRGTEYQLIGTGKMQAENWATYSDENGYENADMQEVAIYRGDDSKLWVRPIAEFNDGRFVDLPAAPTSEE